MRKQNISFTRRLVQLYAALLYNANLKGFIEGEINMGVQKGVCVPGFNCYSCPGAIGACPLGSLQNALTDAGHTAPWYMLGILMIFGITLGRTICGWLCPLGMLQELLHKIPTPKIKKNRVTRALSYFKYVVLAVFVIAIPTWYGLRHGMAMPGFCKYICPAGTFEGGIALLANPINEDLFASLGILFTRKFIVLMILILACVFCYRSFCRFICPLGAIYGLFNRFALTGVKVDAGRCTNCGVCVRNCRMDVRHVGDHECISCAGCMSACAQGAISLKCGKVTLIGPETGKNADSDEVIEKRRRFGRIAWGLALAVLIFALIWFNVIHPPKLPQAPAEPVTTETAVQAEAGNEAAPVQTETAAQAEDTAKADVSAMNAAAEGTVDESDAAAEETASAGTAQDAEDAASADAAQDVPEEDGASAGAAEATAADDAASTGAAEAAAAEDTVPEEAAQDVPAEDAAPAEASQEADGADYSSSAPIGYAEGNQLQDFTTPLIGGGEFHLADYRGKIVFINLWATFCKPCVAELPYFEQLKEAHPDMEILALHNGAFTKEDEVVSFLADKDWKQIKFALDNSDQTLFAIVNGDTKMPQTTVLNRKGEVVYNEKRSMTYEMLEQLYNRADG